MTKKVFISAMEASADKHCAALIYNVLGQLGYYKKLIKTIKNYLKDNEIDLLVVCDSPAFNFHIAKAAKKLNIPVMFYVAPQLWAWAPWRIKKLRKCCDKLCCILPFEEQWFASRGVNVEFVGNPLFDDFDISPLQNVKGYVDFDPNNANICLLPGSREAEVDTLWKPMQEVCLRLSERYANLSITAVANSIQRLEHLKSMQIDGFQCQYCIDTVIPTSLKSDLCLCASGSATLQVAACGCPMVVMYQSSRLMWNLLGKYIILIKHLSLPNILAQRELVPEFMPYFKGTDEIVSRSEKLLNNTDQLKNISSELTRLTSGMADGKTCDRTAKILISMI